MGYIAMNDPNGYWANDLYVARGNEQRLWDIAEQWTFASTIAFLIDDQMISPKIGGGRALEIGCGPGQNLWVLQMLYNMDVTGVDVSPRAKREWETHWGETPRAHFRHENVFTSDWFWGLPEPAFDLVVTRWFLTHVPRGPDKTKLIDKLKAVGLTFVAIEGWYSDPRRPDEFFADDHWVCQDQWEDYGLTEYELFRPHFSKIYYASRAIPDAGRLSTGV